MNFVIHDSYTVKFLPILNQWVPIPETLFLGETQDLISISLWLHFHHSSNA